MTWPTKTDFVDGDVLTAAQVNNIGTNLNEIDPTGITDGYVVTADGSGGMGWEAVNAQSYTQISTGNITASFSLTSIPNTYNELVLDFNNFTTNGTHITITFNNDTATNYHWAYSYSGSTTNALQSSSAKQQTSLRINSIACSSTVPATWRTRIPRYALTSGYKITHTHGLVYDGGTELQVGFSAGGWKSSSAISSIEVTATSVLGGAYTLYGVK